ncbi:MAG: hypothetical protein NVS4B2_07280 [Chloroflexota bacterium]
MILVFGVTFSLLAVMRHHAYQSHAFDLGNMDQAVWNTLHGHPLRFTDMQVGQSVLTSRLAIHVEPLLLLLTPLYWLHAGPESLLVAQAIVAALGAIPAYLLARDRLGRPWLSLIFPAAFLLHPSLQNAVLDDFHAVVLSASLLLWMLYCATRGNAPAFCGFALLAAATKEEISLLVATTGLLFVRRAPRIAAVSIIGGAVWFVFCLSVVIPHFNPTGHSPYLGRYAYLGHGLAGIASGIAWHPRTVVLALTSPSRLEYFDALMHPLAWTSLLALPIVLLSLPSFVINLLSSDPTMYSGFYQYSAEVVPFVIAASAVGVAFIAALARRSAAPGARHAAVVLCLVLLIASLLDCRRFGFTPLSEGYLVPSSGSHQALEDAAIRSIPPDAVVAAADEIEPHISGRRWAYLLPTTRPRNGPASQYIVLDASIPSLPVTPRVLHSTAMHALATGYSVRSARDGILLLQHVQGPRRLPPAFFSFAFTEDAHIEKRDVHWGALRLFGISVHLRSRLVTRSRPAVSVEAYWHTTGALGAQVRMKVYCSPVYQGNHPDFSSSWQVADDAPALSWLPSRSWASHRSIRVAFLPLVPLTDQVGKVDVAIGVEGQGTPQGGGREAIVPANTALVRVATVNVGY